MSIEGVRCRKCGSRRVVKAGLGISRDGPQQRHQCKVCGHVFTVTPHKISPRS